MSLPKIVFSDFDGTLTHGTEFGAIFFESLKWLNERDIPLVIVSGRSISWGHFFMTHLPVEAAIMEGGGVIVTRDDNGLPVNEFLVGQNEMTHLESVTHKILRTNPECQLSADSVGRKTDRAIELISLNERPEMEKKITTTFKGEGVRFSKSSVHLNYWVGDISKFKAVRHYLDHHHSAISIDDCLYFGDAPNDQSMFREMKNSVGVSNIAEFEDRLIDKPAVILKGEENAGPYGVFNYLKSLDSNS